jgi:hypothetical protein
MGMLEPIFDMFIQFWYVTLLLVIIAICKTSWWKGIFGEFIVNSLLSALPKSDYQLIKDVTLPTSDGTTQIDHIVVSKYGIFVVETKNMKGWIFGTPQQKQWTQKIFRQSFKFQNPLHQNYKHTKTLKALLNCEDNKLHSVIVFVGDSTFKSKMPVNVTHSFGSLRYIKGFKSIVFSDQEYAQIIEKIHEIRLQRGIVTNINHRKHVKKIIEGKKS